MFINGCKDYNKDGEAIVTGLAVARVTTAGERKETKSGKPWASASIRVCNNADGTAKFMTIKSFSSCAEVIANLQKGDRVLVAGEIQSRTYNGKQYTDMLVDFISVTSESGVTSAQQSNMNALADRMEGFTEEDDDGLPFF